MAVVVVPADVASPMEAGAGFEHLARKRALTGYSFAAPAAVVVARASVVHGHPSPLMIPRKGFLVS